MAINTLELAGGLREAIGDFVRATRDQAGTPSTAQSESLGVLDRLGPMSVADLAHHRRVKHQSMRLVAGQLETAGLIDRTSDPQDRRSQMVTITAKGRCVLSAFRGASTQSIEAALKTLSEGEQQALRLVIPLLKKMVAAHEG